ncbi:phosphate ABC transporter substrate-binding protein [Alsobacter metallidurans]|uniref:Phosphate ABC transporter substrate-binding protein n=1 Tax=Alsobacter metallidurans TaxID=340221 RepID=A0A917I2I8_9HYPH|nr:substrate-binding domain-containing protein [Alsobacter metallidurans]GGH06797.1 phosphate ABC transporter substrate-binding protein [Alsobacter metallidurans]
MNCATYARAVSLGPLLLAITATHAWSGEITIPGTGDGVEMLRAIGTAFAGEMPTVTVTLPPSIGSGGAVVSVASDREVIGRVARSLSDSERAQGLMLSPVVKVPSAFFTHPGVRMGGLTSAQLAGIYAGAISNWQDVGGPDMRIKVVRREDGDSTLGVLRNSMPGWKDLVITAKSKTALTTQEAVETVRSVEGAIGFGPYSALLRDAVNVLKIDDRAPTEPAYPSAVTIGLIYKPQTVSAEASAFIRYSTGEKAQRIVGSLGGVAPTP